MGASLTKYLNTELADKSPSQVVYLTLGAALAAHFLWFILTQDLGEFRKNVVKKFFELAKSAPGLSGVVQKEKEKVALSIQKEFREHRMKGLKTNTIIPANAVPRDQILKQMEDLRNFDEKNWHTGKISGVIYHGQQEHTEFLNKVYAMFSLSNPLHPEVFPSIRKFESEVIKMTAKMLNADDKVVGAVTSGGTESILMAIKAARDYNSHITNPEMIVPKSAHAAFDKAAEYFKIKIIHVGLDQNFKCIVDEVKKKISSRTVLIVGSAPQYPHGVVDPIRELAALAKSKNILFHTDACLGGFYLPWAKKMYPKEIPDFDFSVPGVTSISCDTHKYGFTVKGTSVVLFRTPEIRNKMYFVTTEWPGGTYASPTISGSRAGGVIACCWASLMAIGQENFMKYAKGIYETADAIKKGIQQIPELQLLGNSESSVVAFTGKELNPFMINDALKLKGWILNTLLNPNGLHIAVTVMHIGKADELLKDLREAVEIVKKDPKRFEKGGAAIYGMAATFPDREVIADVARIFIDNLLDIIPEEPQKEEEN